MPCSLLTLAKRAFVKVLLALASSYSVAIRPRQPWHSRPRSADCIQAAGVKGAPRQRRHKRGLPETAGREGKLGEGQYQLSTTRAAPACDCRPRGQYWFGLRQRSCRWRGPPSASYRSPSGVLWRVAARALEAVPAVLCQEATLKITLDKI